MRYEQFDALRRAETGRVTFDDGFVLAGPRDSLSSIPPEAVQAEYAWLADRGLIVVDGSTVGITDAGRVAFGTGRVEEVS